MEDGVLAHLNALGDKHVFGGAVGRVAGELAERALGFPGFRQDLAFDHNLGAVRHFQIGGAASCDTIGLAKQGADDLVFSDVRRIVIGHRSHIMDRMNADHDGRRQRLTARLGPAMEFIHAAA